MPPTKEIDITDSLRQCEKPFAFDEHGIIYKKSKPDAKETTPEIDNIFILKDAIRRRLTQTDPHWTTGTQDLMGIQGDVVIMRGALTFLGGQRTAVGTGKIQSTRYGKPIDGYELAREVSKAMKSASSDLIPRLATEWNIGSYLRQLPKTITTESAFKGWLDGQVKAWEQRYHWAGNGKGSLFWHLIKAYGLTWEIVQKELEPGRMISGLREISLSDMQAFVRLEEIKREHQ
jgi:hypothetical protein